MIAKNATANATAKAREAGGSISHPTQSARWMGHPHFRLFGKSNGNDRSRFPSGMTTKNAKAKTKAREAGGGFRFPTQRKVRVGWGTLIFACLEKAMAEIAAY
jgi:hypothetical protein